MELAKVIAPYEATSKEQLTLTKGQMIMVKKRTETGWWQGEVQGGVSSVQYWAEEQTKGNETLCQLDWGSNHPACILYTDRIDD